jgi:hypothetical protein
LAKYEENLNQSNNQKNGKHERHRRKPKNDNSEKALGWGKVVGSLNPSQEQAAAGSQDTRTCKNIFSL